MDVWGVVIFVLSVMRLVGGVSSCRCCGLVSVVHPVAILGVVFCVICSLFMLVVTIWWKRTPVLDLLWLCMLRESFPFVPPMLLM